ncbi:MAG: PKD domain-containing protein, partial [Bacteroidia bacterium]
FGDASPVVNILNPSHIYPDSGTYSTTLIVQSSYGCRDTVTNNVKVYGLPVANFTYQNICVSDSANFTNTSTPNTGSTLTGYVWNFGDNSPTSTLTNPKHKYNTEGTYTITLIVSTNHGCTDTISKNIVIHPLPTPLFTTNTEVCHGKVALFTENSSIINTDTLMLWQWNFGDNSPILNQQQVNGGHLYASTGNYNVTLTVTSTFGCIDSISESITVRPKPIANFSSTNECFGDLTEFSDSSTTATGTINLWNWSVGDGTPPKSTQNPSHTYATAGIFETTLIVQNNYGCSDTIKKNVTVYFNPVANFTAQNVCLNDSVFFIDSSFVDTSAYIDDFLWVFNDGSPTSNVENPVHLYNNHGIYNVTLLTTTNQGCTDAVSNTVSVFDPPQTSFSFNNVCLYDSAVFINTSANPTMGTIESLLWNFGDGTFNNFSNQPHHQYNAVGDYQITLITRSSNLACADTIHDSITIYPIPVANFTANDVCLGQSVSFIDSSTVSNSNTINTWAWNFDNGGAINNQQNPSNTYDNFGQYTVQLIVASNHQCKDTITQNVVVHPNPSVNFVTENVCLNDTSFFTNQSTIDTNITNDTINAWTWNFGDNSTQSTTTSTQHLYQSVATYTVSLHTSSNFGCVDSVSKTIVINPNPTVIFSASDTIGCEPLCIGFNNLSIIISGGNAQWSWDFGDGITSTNENSNHCYFNDSIFSQKQYSVNLVVTSDSGCVAQTTKTNFITVYPLPVANFSLLPTTATITNPVIELIDSSIGTNSWNWNFGDNDTSTSSTPPPHTYADTGTYTVQLIVQTNYQCLDTAYNNVVIEPDFMFFVPNAFSPNDDGVNDSFIGQGIFINEFNMFIFDRWGNLIYQTDDLNKPWDGKVKNGAEPAQTDVYIYSINLTNFKGDKYKYKGTVTLVR